MCRGALRCCYGFVPSHARAQRVEARGIMDACKLKADT